MNEEAELFRIFSDVKKGAAPGREQRRKLVEKDRQMAVENHQHRNASTRKCPPT
jgi:hypothetical protein